jgi:hypothetical protein
MANHGFILLVKSSLSCFSLFKLHGVIIVSAVTSWYRTRLIDTIVSTSIVMAYVVVVDWCCVVVVVVVVVSFIMVFVFPSVKFFT